MQFGHKEQPFKHHLSADWSLQLETMKSESLVIVDQHATVNLYLSLVHTARHTLKVNCTQKNTSSLSFNRKSLPETKKILLDVRLE